MRTALPWSTTTLSGQQLARRHISDVDALFYFPFDWTFTARRTLDLVKPKLFVMMAAIALTTFGTLVGSYELLFPDSGSVFVA